MIEGVTQVRIGAAGVINDGDAFKEFLKEFEETESFRRLVDLDLTTAVVCAAQSIENVRRAFYSEQIRFQLRVSIKRKVQTCLRECAKHDKRSYRGWFVSNPPFYGSRKEPIFTESTCPGREADSGFRSTIHLRSASLAPGH